ncbi:MAG: hypothetical protein GYA51_01955 [Candidatus Methanofastidiosa archaeon]|nr:hypothetical protein [Candidatus Methanofastidiosa archaeon]
MYFSIQIVNGTVLPGTANIHDSSEKDIRSSTRYQWEKSTLLPSFIDDHLKDISRLRAKFTKAWDYAGSNIDTDVVLTSSNDVISYIPRAAQIAFLAPFPNFWFSQGKKVAGSAMRMVSSFEMIFIYALLCGFPLTIWHYRRCNVLQLVIFVCSTMLIIYAITVPNLGALYRFRYPYLMPIVCLGMAGWLHMKTFIFTKRKIE